MVSDDVRLISPLQKLPHHLQVAFRRCDMKHRRPALGRLEREISLLVLPEEDDGGLEDDKKRKGDGGVHDEALRPRVGSESVGVLDKQGGQEHVLPGLGPER